MLKTILAALVAFLLGAAGTTLKKDKVILELKRENSRLRSWDHIGPAFRNGYQQGHNRGWLDRNMDSESLYRFPDFN